MKTLNCSAAKLGNHQYLKQSHNTSLASQRSSILRWFADISPRLSTLDARERLGIMSPASRVLELRRRGHEIKLEWTQQVDAAGTTHKSGVYIYCGLDQGGNV